MLVNVIIFCSFLYIRVIRVQQLLLSKFYFTAAAAAVFVNVVVTAVLLQSELNTQL